MCCMFHNIYFQIYYKGVSHFFFCDLKIVEEEKKKVTLQKGWLNKINFNDILTTKLSCNNKTVKANDKDE